MKANMGVCCLVMSQRRVS